MSSQTGNVSVVAPTSSTWLAADKEVSVVFALTRFKAAPTVADTSVSRQTGLAGIWKKSFDPASLTLPPQSGATSTTKNNTLVVRPENRCAALQIQCKRRDNRVAAVHT